MTILLLLIPIGMGLLILAIAAFVWAVSNGQYEDLEGEGSRILFEEDPVPSRGRMRDEPARRSTRVGVKREEMG